MVLEMNDKKPDGYKVSWGSWKDAFETLVHIVCAIGIVYAVYSFFAREQQKVTILKIQKQKR